MTELDKRLELEQANLLAELRQLMHREWGRALVWSLLEKTGVFQISFDTDPLVMAFREGRRSIGNELFADLFEAAPDLYELMRTEAAARDELKNELRRQDEGETADIT